MFSGWTNQVSSWVGGMKPGQNQEAAANPENAEEQVEAPAAGSPVTTGTEGAAAPESEAPKTTLFSGMKNQMSSWLTKKDKDEEQPEAAKEEAVEAAPAAEVEAEKAVGEESAEGAEAAGSDVQAKAMQGVRSIGSFFSSAVTKAGRTVTEAGAKIKKTVEDTNLLTEFNKEQEAFIKAKNKTTEEALPPWVGYPEEETLKEEILSLSTDRRNFVRSPPAGVQFQFDYETFYPVALATLAVDPNLETMRFELVPKIIKEELFWRNYFYRVSLIRQSTQLSTMTQGGNRTASRESSFDEDDKTDEADTPSDSPVHEFVSDAFQSQTLSKDLKEVQEGIKRLGGTESSMKPNE